MKTTIKIVAVCALLSVPGFTQVGLGYDIGLNQIKLRIPVNEMKIDVGMGFLFDDSQPTDERFGFGMSGMFLVPIASYSPLACMAMGGLNFQKLDQPNDNIVVTLFGGLQPELTLWERLVVTTRIGLSIPVTPHVEVGTFGNGVLDLGAGMSFFFLL